MAPREVLGSTSPLLNTTELPKEENDEQATKSQNSLASTNRTFCSSHEQELLSSSPPPSSSPLTIVFSVFVYWSFVSLIPIYNKFFFHKDHYPFPIASAGIQLGIVSFLLAILSILRHFIEKCHRRGQPSKVTSWIFGPGTWYKITWTAPIGILFGLKYGVTNLGLALLPAPTHLLLQATDLVWTCLAAWFIKDDRLDWVGYSCVAACIVGSAITSYTTVIQSSMHDGSSDDTTTTISFDRSQWWAIGVNLLSPMLLGLCLATLRVACKRLLIPCNPNLGGTTMDSFELTCWKLVMSSSVALAFACLMEGPKTILQDDNTLIIAEEGWFTAFADLPRFSRLGVILGSVLILVFQVNCTFLTHLTNAYAVGLVGQLKIIPQWVTAALIAPTKSFHLHPGNVLGAFITMIAAGVFAFHNFHQFQKQDQSVASLASGGEESQRLLDPNQRQQTCYDPEALTSADVENEKTNERQCHNQSYLFCNLW